MKSSGGEAVECEIRPALALPKLSQCSPCGEINIRSHIKEHHRNGAKRRNAPMRGFRALVKAMVAK